MALVNNIDICIYIYCVNYFIYTVCMPEMLTSIRVSSINIKPVDHHQAPSLQVRLEQLDKQHLQVLWTTDVVCSVPRLMFSSFAAFYLGEQTFHRTSISIAMRGLEQLTLKVCYCSFRKAMPVIGSNFIIYPACRHNCNDSCNFAEALHGMCMLRWFKLDSALSFKTLR